MSCITQLLKMKGDAEILPINDELVIEGGGVYKGYEYVITFTSHGHRCGYVAIPDSHHGDNDEIQCHGGITFSSQSHIAKELLPVPCNDLWIGFDAAHWRDSKCLKTAKKYFPNNETIDYMLKSPLFNEELPQTERPFFHDDLLGGKPWHKNYDFMESECKSIIDQLVGE